jgi:hypothetical protein
MRTLLVVLLLLVMGLVGLGFYRGWFSSAKTGNPESGRQGVQIEVDQNRIRSDIEKAKEKIGGAGGQTRDKGQGQQP